MKNLYTIDLTKDKSKFNNYISNTLIEKIENSIKKWKKSIIYINKRWDYNFLVCKDCNYLFKCDKCDVWYSIHKNPPKMICHHCWQTSDIKITCEKCKWVNLEKVWVGTQQIEASLWKIFPQNNIFRIDTDKIKTLKEKNKALENIKNSDIIIWTKMITTWFDFKGIWTIWVILLEQELQIPKYDTEEKIYSNIKQLIWRWWRSWEETDIIIQTFIPNNEMVKNIIELNYKDFFLKTLEERKLFSYPPFSKIITLRYKHKDKVKSFEYTKNLKETLDKYNLKDEFEIIFVNTPIKRNNQFFYKIIIKWKNPRKILKNIKTEIFKNKDLTVIFDD